MVIVLVLGFSFGSHAQYCTSSLYDLACSEGDNIESFSTTGGTTNITNNNTGCNSAIVGFTYFSNLSHTAAPGSTVTFSITNNIDYEERYKIWVDWNSDFDFTDAGEELYSMVLLDGQTATGSFVIPASTTTGTKRLRVRCVYDTSSPVTACSFEEYGEIEDYNLIVSGTTAPCNAPTGLAASGTTASGATLSWTAVSGATGYEYVLDQVATNPIGAGAATTATTYPAGSLTPSTTYYFHLRTKCGTTAFSAWTSVSFTTAAASGCTAPTGLTASSVTSTSASLFWTAVTGATGYEYILDQVATNPTGSGAALTTTTLPTGGLTPSTTYFFHLRTKCGATTFSPWTVVSFTTATSTATCPLPTAVTVANTSATAVSLSWPAVPGATGYEYANGTSPTPPASGTSVTTTTASVSSLTTGIVYYAHVRTKCGTTLSTWRTTQYTKATTSIASAASSDGFNVTASPNPAGDVMTVRVEGVPSNHASQLLLIDLAGRVLRQAPATGKETTFDLTGLPAGMYLLRYAGAEHSGVVRVQKL